MAVESDDILVEAEGADLRKLMRIMIIIFVVLLSIMGSGFYVLWSKVSPVDPQSEQIEEKIVAEEDAQDLIRPVFSLDTFIVNLSDRGGTRYLRTTIDLELTSKDTTAELEKRLPQIRNTILMTIPSRSAKDINTIEGKIALRDEIMEKLNSFIRNGSVTNIYFTEFVVQ